MQDITTIVKELQEIDYNSKLIQAQTGIIITRDRKTDTYTVHTEAQAEKVAAYAEKAKATATTAARKPKPEIARPVAVADTPATERQISYLQNLIDTCHDDAFPHHIPADLTTTGKKEASFLIDALLKY